MKDFFNKEPDLVIEKDGCTYNCYLEGSKVEASKPYDQMSDRFKKYVKEVANATEIDGEFPYVVRALCSNAWHIEKVTPNISDLNDLLTDYQMSGYAANFYFDTTNLPDDSVDNIVIDTDVNQYPNGSKLFDFCPIEIFNYQYTFAI